MVDRHVSISDGFHFRELLSVETIIEIAKHTI